jgi:hypothetical protein
MPVCASQALPVCVVGSAKRLLTSNRYCRRHWRCSGSSTTTPLQPWRLHNRWIVFAGDSTHRNLHDAFLKHLRDCFNATLRVAVPRVGGWVIIDDDLQKDHDTVVTFSRSGHAFSTLLISMRFLRGLDLHKLERNADDWRQRLHYPNWLERSRRRPPNLVYASDSFSQDPLGGYWTARSPQPDLLFLHSCAWDLPQVNRSGEYYPHMAPGATCEPPPATQNVTVLDGLCETHKKADDPPCKEWNEPVRTLGAPCIRRGAGLSDRQIYDGFSANLRAAVRLTRASLGPTGRLLLRNCHTGVNDSRPGAKNQQFQALGLMSASINVVAAQACVPLFDVWGLDSAAGHQEHQHAGPEDFHMPELSVSRTALIALLAFQQLFR